MPKARLSRRVVDAAGPGEKPYIIYDQDLPGFGLRVMPTGRRTYIVEYRPGGGGRRSSTRRMSLGTDSALTADEARREAKLILASVRLGADPAARRQESRAMPSVAEFAERFKEEVCVAPRLKPNTARLYRNNLRNIIVPHIGTLKLDAVTRGDVARMHRRVGATRPTTANNVLVTVASLFKFAATEHFVPEGTNPARGVERFKLKAKERFLSGTEFARLGDAIREFETIGLPWSANELADPSRAKHRAKAETAKVVMPPDVASAIRLLIFTGCRKSEILGLRWAEVDFERGLLLLDDTKTGRRTVVLNAPALAVMAQLPRVGHFVFPGARADEPRGDITGYWYRLRERAGLNGADGAEPVRLHDLRHTFASFGVSGGMGLPIVGKLLGHTQAATTARYSHLDADPVRKASERIGAAIAAHTGDGKRAADDEVVEIRPNASSGQRNG